MRAERWKGLPANEHIAMEAILFNYTVGRIAGDAAPRFHERGKAEAAGREGSHAGQPELAAIIEEQER